MRSLDVSFPAGALMGRAVPRIPGRLRNDRAYCDSVNLELDLGKWVFPAFVPPNGLNAKDYLAKISHEMLDAKYGGKAPDEATARLEYELGIISKKGYDPYFLVVADYTNWARHKRDHFHHPRQRRRLAGFARDRHFRGQPAVLQIAVRALFKSLPPSPPDIDMDFADNRREEVLEYVKGKYGADKVAQICTFGTMQARAAVRDVTRALGLPYAFGDRLCQTNSAGRAGFCHDHRPRHCRKYRVERAC